jgi:arabinogalactan oligomer/maltooligosaccharide transport system permease protein
MATVNQEDVRAPSAMRPPTTFWNRTANTRSAYFYMLPALLIMGVITFYPLLFQVWMSFTDYGLRNLRVGAPAPTFVGVDNYIRILQNNIGIPNFNFLGILVFNLWWAVSNVVLHLVFGVLIAVLLNTEGLWFKRIYRAIYVLPVVIPALIIATVWRNMFDPDYGPINQMLQSIGSLFGISPDVFRIRWIDQVDHPFPFIPLPLSFFAMLLANVWLGWPLNAVVATGALQSIPKELYEAADIDGANGRQQFFNITLPMLRPAMIPYAIYGFVLTFNLFHISYFLSGGGPLRQTELLITQAYRLVNEQKQYGVAAAFAVLMFFILLAISVVTSRMTKATANYAD